MMTVRWSPKARTALDQTADFIQKEFGSNSKVQFKLEVRRVNNLLKLHPHLGSIEPLLADFPSTYRSIVVNRLNKIVYRVVDDHIEIADFWDVRREPQSLAKRMK